MRGIELIGQEFGTDTLARRIEDLADDVLFRRTCRIGIGPVDPEDDDIAVGQLDDLGFLLVRPVGTDILDVRLEIRESDIGRVGHWKTS
ncbi:MAG: hypothetical protein ACPH5G_12440 [Pseudooceanicola atlanticus]